MWLEAVRLVKAVWAAPANVLQNVVKIRIVATLIAGIVKIASANVMRA